MGLKLVIAGGIFSALAVQQNQHTRAPAVIEAQSLVGVTLAHSPATLPPGAAPLPPARLSVVHTSRVEPFERDLPPGASQTWSPGRAGSIPSVPLRLPQVSPTGPASAFAAEVIRLSVEADGVDRLWQVYKSECGVRVGRQYDFGREWFSIWDRAAEAAIDAPECRDLLWRLLQSGDSVRRDLLRARAVARRAVLDEGTEVGMLRWHGLQWP